MKKIMATIAILLLVSCGNDPITVEYEDDMVKDNDIVTIKGNTDLQEGSIINYYVENNEEIIEEGTTQVEGGAFSYSVDTSNYRGDIFEVFTLFLPNEQPDGIKEVYGENGENMSIDENVIESSDNEDVNTIKTRKTFEKD